MKKLILYFSFLFSAAVVLTACLKDKGNYDYSTLPAFYIDTVGEQTHFEVYQSAAPVEINPKIVFEGDTSDLSYLYLLYGSSGPIDTLSTERKLSAVISRTPGNYTIQFEAKQSNDLKAFMLYTVVVLPAVPSGWMVMYENNDAPGTTEIDLIRSPLFISANPAVPDTVFRSLYSRFNSNQSLQGTPKDIIYGGVGIYALTSSKVVSLQRTDFRKLQDLNQMFTFPPPSSPSPQGMFLGIGNAPTLFSNNSVYWSMSNSFVGKVSMTGNYEAAPFLYFQYGQYGGFYDQLNKRFLIINQYSSSASTYPDAGSGARFNLNDIGKDLLFVERSAGANASPPDPYKLAFLKDVSGPGRYVYIINTATPLNPDVAVLDLTTGAPEIEDAILYAAGNIGNTAFYATPSSVYYFNYSTASSTYSTPVAAFNAPAGEEITAMDLYKGHSFNAISNDSRTMMIATWNASTSTGKVYFVEVDATSGALGAPIQSWTVEGRVEAMAFKTN